MKCTSSSVKRLSKALCYTCSLSPKRILFLIILSQKWKSRTFFFFFFLIYQFYFISALFLDISNIFPWHIWMQWVFGMWNLLTGDSQVHIFQLMKCSRAKALRNAPCWPLSLASPKPNPPHCEIQRKYGSIYEDIWIKTVFVSFS